MKSKLLALTLALLMLVSSIPVGAIGMVAVETADEVSTVIPEAEEEAEVMAELPDGVLFEEDFTGKEGTSIYDYSTKKATPFYFEHNTDILSRAFIQNGDQKANVSVVKLGDGNEVIKVLDGDNSEYRMLSIYMNLDAAFTRGFKAGENSGKFTLTYKYKPVTTFAGIAHRTDGKIWSSDSNAWVTGYNWWGYSGAQLTNDWHDASVDFRIADDGCYYYLNNSAPSKQGYLKSSENGGMETSFTRLDFVLTQPKSTSSEIYFDDIKLTYQKEVDLKYVDKNGNSIKNVLDYEGNQIILSNATVGNSYATQFEINGVKYDNGDTYTIPFGVNEVTITASKYDMPEDAPVNAIFYEDFDHTSSLSNVYSPFTYFDEDYYTDTLPAFGSYGGGKSYTTFDGKTTLKIVNNDAASPYYGIKWSNLGLNKPGKYVFNVKTYTETDKDFAFSNFESSMPVYELVSGIETGRSWNQQSNISDSASTDNTWRNRTGELIITEGENGQLYNKTTAISQLDRILWYMTRSYAVKGEDGATTNVKVQYNKAGVTYTEVNVYFDETYLCYFAPVTVKYVDAATGATLKTVETYQYSQITLPAKADLGITYNYPVFTVDGLTYKKGDVITIPANAGSEYIITVSRPEFPANAPANAILFEDFENRDTTITNAVATNFSFVSYAANDSGTIGEYSVSSSYNPVYAADPKDADNTVLKVTGTTQYDNGLNIKNLAISEVGKYVVSYDWYTDASLTAHPNCSCFARIYWRDASNADKFKDMAQIGGNKFNTEEYRNSWHTKQYQFEIYEENGVKYFVSGSNRNELPKGSVFGFELYMENPAATADNLYTVYYDNVSVTVERPKTYTATFKNVYDEAFAYTTTQTTYDSLVLPTAADLGLGYEPKFTLDYEEYFYPGDKFFAETDETSFEFIVVPSNVIYKENFDDETSTTGADGTADYARGDAAGGKPTAVRVAEKNGSNAYFREINGWQNFAIASGIALDTPGVYTIKYDVSLDKLSSTVTSTTIYTMMHGTWKDPTGVNTNPDATTNLKSISLTPDSPSATVTVKLELYKNANGVLAYKNDGKAEKELNVNGTCPRVVVAADPKGLTDVNTDGSIEPVRVYVDNFTIEFEPYAPTAVKMASFREEDADGLGGPAGIRFASYVTSEQREVAAEYGYVVTLRDYIDNGDGTYAYEKLFIDNVDSVSATETTNGTNTAGVKFVAAAAYNGTVDRIYVLDGSIFDNGKLTYRGIEETFYTGVLYGITSDEQKKTVFVARPYIKVNGVYYYGDCHETSYNAVYNAAKANA